MLRHLLGLVELKNILVSSLIFIQKLLNMIIEMTFPRHAGDWL